MTDRKASKLSQTCILTAACLFRVLSCCIPLCLHPPYHHHHHTHTKTPSTTLLPLFLITARTRAGVTFFPFRKIGPFEKISFFHSPSCESSEVCLLSTTPCIRLRGAITETSSQSVDVITACRGSLHLTNQLTHLCQYNTASNGDHRALVPEQRTARYLITRTRPPSLGLNDSLLCAQQLIAIKMTN